MSTGCCVVWWQGDEVDSLKAQLRDLKAKYEELVAQQ